MTKPRVAEGFDCSSSFAVRGLFAQVWFAVLDNAESLETALQARVPWPVTFYVEYLETRRFENAGYELVETLRHTYGGEKLDLVIVEVYPALRFALKHRDELFAGVPIVFMAVTQAGSLNRRCGLVSPA